MNPEQLNIPSNEKLTQNHPKDWKFKRLSQHQVESWITRFQTSKSYKNIFNHAKGKVEELIRLKKIDPGTEGKDMMQEGFSRILKTSKKQGYIIIRYRGRRTAEKTRDAFGAYVGKAVKNVINEYIRKNNRYDTVHSETLGHPVHRKVKRKFIVGEDRDFGTATSKDDSRRAGDYTNLGENDRSKIASYEPNDERTVELIDLIEKYVSLSQREDFPVLLQLTQLKTARSSVDLSRNYVEILNIAAFLNDVRLVKDELSKKPKYLRMSRKQKIALLHKLRNIDPEETARILGNENQVYINRSRALSWLKRWTKINRDKPLPIVLAGILKADDR